MKALRFAAAFAVCWAPVLLLWVALVAVSR